MKKVFYLKSCGTCTKILKQFDLSDWELREIKSKPISEEELSEMFEKTKSYEALFSRRSTQIKAQNIDVKSLKEDDFKKDWHNIIEIIEGISDEEIEKSI